MTMFPDVNPRGRGKLGKTVNAAGGPGVVFAVWNASNSLYNINVARPATERPLILPSPLQVERIRRMKRLCTCTGGGFGVAALATLGLVSAMSFTTTAWAQECAQPNANCQLPDQLGHDNTVGATSDGNPDAGFEVSDNFVAAGTTIENICWWGFYLDFDVPEDCGPGGVPDLFTVTYYENIPGFPATPDLLTIIGGPFTQGVDLTVTKGATGAVIPSGAGDLAEFEYTGSHAPVTVTPGACYWIAVQNDSTGSDPACFWLWSTAPTVTEEPIDGKGDGNSYQDGGGGTSDYDLAFCLDSALTPDPGTVCDFPINEGCLDAVNDCGTPSIQPGCTDHECCTIVCQTLAFCCLNFWNQQCVEAAALDCVFVPPAPEPCPPLAAENCQLPDLSGSGGLNDDTFIGSSSDLGVNTVIADNFVAAETAEISEVCWWGFYSDGSEIPDCGLTAVDDFTVTFYADNGSALPGTVLGSFDISSGLVVTRIPETVHPGVQTTPDDDLIVYRYLAVLPPLPVISVEEFGCYWLEITNQLDGTCVWFWETAPNNGTGTDDFDYSLQDDTTGYDYTDAQDLEMGWCLDIVLGDVATCAPANPQELCDPAGSILLTQNTDPLTISVGNSVACVAEDANDIQRYNTENYFARSYDLGVGETAGLDVEVICVRVAVESNDGSAYPTEVNIYEDVNGNEPQSPAIDLNLLGTTVAWIPVNTALGFVEARFDPPVSVPADTVMVVELFMRERNPSFIACDVDSDCDGLICVGDPNPGDGTPEGFCDSVFDSGGMWPGTNNLGETADSYLRSPSCGVNSYLSVTAIGFPQSMLIQEVHLGVASDCPCDCNTTPDGVVNTQDFLALLAQWGGPGSCDCKEPADGVVDTQDFLAILATWGPCP